MTMNADWEGKPLTIDEYCAELRKMASPLKSGVPYHTRDRKRTVTIVGSTSWGSEGNHYSMRWYHGDDGNDYTYAGQVDKGYLSWGDLVEEVGRS